MTSGTLMIVELLGGIALLLWGVRMVRTAVMRGWGERLKGFIEQRLSNSLPAFGGGMVVTAVLGSATAMALIVAGLAGSGAIGAAAGLAVLLGADVGSALVSGLFASGSTAAASLAPLFLFAGYVTFSASTEFRPRNIGRLLMGLGLMLLALKGIVGATAPLRDAALFHEVLTALTREPVLGFLLGVVLTWACHSTLAVVLLVASFLLNGSLDVEGALPVILGINFGGGLPAVTATLDQPPEARRLPLANLVCRGTVALALLAAVHPLVGLVERLPLDPVHVAAGLHAAFNLCVAAIFLPLSGQVVALVSRILPDAPVLNDTLAAPRYLDTAAFASPAAALSNAATETARMSELLERMFTTALDVLATQRLEGLKEIEANDLRLGHYLRSVHGYLGRLAQTRLGPEEGRRTLDIMLYASHLEHAGDVIKFSLADRIRTKVKLNVGFTPDQQTALSDLCAITTESLRLVPAAVASNDVGAAARLATQKDRFRRIEDKVVSEHLGSAAAGPMSLRKSALFIDIVRDLHRINSHIASSGYPSIQAAGLLYESRIRKL
ncbi:Na/Pi cotransporter family protein [Paracoccus luteus]|uniref:Na/Pi cotransporter family protein n=1 Tax=Paracoccus luteus TaxID=2508543 RepID=UPI00106F78EE|nr:Na/Pi cotransporter family protein [Paracoccus luteus]